MRRRTALHSTGLTSRTLLQEALTLYERTRAEERPELLNQESVFRSLSFLTWLAQHEAASPAQKEMVEQLGNELLQLRRQAPDPSTFPAVRDTSEEAQALIALSPGPLQRGPWTAEGEAIALKQVRELSNASAPVKCPLTCWGLAARFAWLR
jgi:hypothetical protein